MLPYLPYFADNLSLLIGAILGKGIDDAQILKRTKDEMDYHVDYLKRNNRIKEAEGLDNYYHRKGMHEVARGGLIDAGLGFFGGALKEGFDAAKKLPQKSLWEIIVDSNKDLGNNNEALLRGLTNSEEDGKIWLKKLDYKNNKWIK